MGRRLSLIAAALASLVLADPARAETWRVGAFSIVWADGFQRMAGTDAIQFLNPDGVGVTLDVLGHPPLSLEDEKAAADRWRTYARTAMAATAARHGLLAMPLTQTKLASGGDLFSIGVEQRADGRSSFGLFFLIVSPDARIAQIVVEGPGPLSEADRRFRPLIATAQWAPNPQ